MPRKQLNIGLSLTQYENENTRLDDGRARTVIADDGLRPALAQQPSVIGSSKPAKCTRPLARAGQNPDFPYGGGLSGSAEKFQGP